MRCKIYLLFFFVLTGKTAFAQHEHVVKNGGAIQAPISFALVKSQFLTDSTLEGYKMESLIMTMKPGAEDTVSHRHDCDLFGYVLEGEVQIGLEYKVPLTYRTGEMFFEKKNVLHNLARNNMKENSSKILLVFIIKSGREGYIPVHPAISSAK